MSRESPERARPHIFTVGWRAALLLTVASLAVVLSGGCREPAPSSTSPIRLVDLFTAELLQDPQPVAEPQAPIVWQFGAGAVDGWQAPVGVEGWRTEDGLVGRSTTDFPIVHGTHDGPLEDQELVHAIEIRMRVSAGSRLAIQLSGQAPDDWQQAARPIFPWPFEAPLIADGESHLYTLKPQGMRPVQASQLRHLTLRPTDVAGAEFTIESLRVVLRSEHLASIPSGIGWHGMEGIYYETLVSRSGETLRFPVQLPANPQLHWSMASSDAEPAEFRVAVDVAGTVHELQARRPEEPYRWQRADADLSRFAGQQVELLLQLVSATDDGSASLGFWGAPVVHSRRHPATAPGTEADASAVAEGQAPKAAPQGVIVLLADTLRRDHLPFYGYERDTAPVLASMVEQGTLAEDAIAQATWTKASVPSIFTSMYPSTHGVEHFTDRLPASADTMAEIFRRAGYATLGLSSITFTGRFTNLHQGYEEFHESSSLPMGTRSKNARFHVDRLLDWLDHHEGVPFFVFLHVADPHSPYEPYAPFDTQWGSAGDREAYLAQQDASRPFIDNRLMRAFGMPPRSALEAAGVDPQTYVGYEHDAYDGSILGMDVEIGRLVEGLRSKGLEDSVLLAFVSDHGTEFLDHDYHFHGHSVYGELNRVPMFFWGPGYVPAGRRIPARVQTLDLMPTVLELAGLEIPAAAQGQSLVPWMREDTAAGDVPAGFRRRPAFTEKAQHLTGASPQDAESMAFSILVDDWKLVHHVERPDDRPEFELFRPSADPLDQVDLASQHPDVVQRLAEQLTAWRQQAAAARLADDGLAEDLSPEEMERLRSLGYM